MTTQTDVLAVLDYSAETFGQHGWNTSANALLEARAAVDDVRHHATQLLRYIDSAHGDQFRQAIDLCAIPGSVHIDGLRAALANMGPQS